MHSGVVQGIVVRCNAVHKAAMRHSVVQCSAMWCGAGLTGSSWKRRAVRGGKCGATQGSAVQCGAVQGSNTRCNALWCDAVHCIAVQSKAGRGNEE